MKKWIAAFMIINIAIASFCIYLLMKKLDKDDTSTPDQTQIEESSDTTAKADSKSYYGTPYAVALEDAGAHGQMIGCNDSKVALPALTVLGPSKEEALTKAITKLLTSSTESLITEVRNETDFADSLTNTLYQPQLQILKTNIEGTTAHIYFTGSVSLGGACDIPRFEQQLRSTALSVYGLTDVIFYLNNSKEEFEKILSLK